MIDWSRVWGRPMGYMGTLREVFRLLYQAHQNGRDTRNFLPRIRDIIENRECDIQRHLQRDPGHDHAVRYWRLFEIAVLVVVNFGAVIITGGVVAPEVLSFLAAQGVIWEEIAVFFTFLRK